MGTVHGVYLKYVALSGMSYAGYSVLSSHDASTGGRGLMEDSESSMRDLPRLFLGYSALLNLGISALFKMEWGMGKFFLCCDVVLGTVC